jgi:hypothetical protein
MSTVLDLFIQDFVTTNKLLNQLVPWSSLVNRRFAEESAIKVFEFVSNNLPIKAVGQYLILPDGDWFRIELTHAIPEIEEHRFDCLRMTHRDTHTSLTVEKEEGALLIFLKTRNRGLINLVFVIRDSSESLKNPFLV